MSQNTVARPGPLDPIATSEPDEPTFPLVGRDPDASATIRFWSDHRRKRLTSEVAESPEPTEKRMSEIREDLERCTAADELADEFDDWRLHRDAAPKEAARATIHDAGSEQSKVRIMRQKALQELGNAAAAANDALEAWRPLMDDLTDEEQQALRAAAGTLKLMSINHGPARRIGYQDRLGLENNETE